MPEDPDPPPINVSDIDSAPTSPIPLPGDVPVSADQLRYVLARLGEENADLKQALEETIKRVKTTEILDQLIEPMAKRSFVFMCCYCGVVAALVTLDGFKLGGFGLPESVLRFLVGSTATTVIGLVGMVLTGIFVGARGRGGNDR